MKKRININLNMSTKDINTILSIINKYNRTSSCKLPKFDRPKTHNANLQLYALNKQLKQKVNSGWNLYTLPLGSCLYGMSMDITNGWGSALTQNGSDPHNTWWSLSINSNSATKLEIKKVISLVHSFCLQEDIPFKIVDGKEDK